MMLVLQRIIFFFSPLFFVFPFASYSCPLRIFLQKYGEEPVFILSAKKIAKIMRNREMKRDFLLVVPSAGGAVASYFISSFFS
jgi:hypothetical protein